MTLGRGSTAARQRPRDPSSLLLPLSEARRRIDAAGLPKLVGIALPTHQALGQVAAADVHARHPEPRVDLAAMDGFAVRFPRGRARTRFRLKPGLITATSRPAALAPGDARRIVTGAPVPRGADAVVRQERALALPVELRLRRPVARGTDIHRLGEDWRAGSRLVAEGERIRPYHVAALLAQGIDRVRVRIPRVAFVAVGDELLPRGPCGGGRVRDSITPLIAGFLPSTTPRMHRSVGDNLPRIVATLRALARRADLIVTVGGTSVGARDRTKAAVARAGRLLFGGVRVNVLKRGAVGLVGRVPVVLLPGQVVSAVAVWHEHGRRVLARRLGIPLPRAQEVRLLRPLANPHPMDSLYLLRVDRGRATPLRWGVRWYSELLRANATAVVPRRTVLPAGSSLRATGLEGTG